MTFHPVTLEQRDCPAQIGELLLALDGLPDLWTVFTHAQRRRRQPRRGRGDRTLLREPSRQGAVPSPRWARAATCRCSPCADICLGNSSSGVIEAPALGTPTVDVGERQAGRDRAACVLHCEPQAGGYRGDAAASALARGPPDRRDLPEPLRRRPRGRAHRRRAASPDAHRRNAHQALPRCPGRQPDQGVTRTFRRRPDDGVTRTFRRRPDHGARGLRCSPAGACSP